MLAAAAFAGAMTALAPVAAHDSREELHLTSVAAARVDAPDRGRDTRPAVYGRAAARDEGGASLQYWLPYAGQDQDRGAVRTGRREGDGELV